MIILEARLLSVFLIARSVSLWYTILHWSNLSITIIAIRFVNFIISVSTSVCFVLSEIQHFSTKVLFRSGFKSLYGHLWFLLDPHSQTNVCGDITCGCVSHCLLYLSFLRFATEWKMWFIMIMWLLQINMYKPACSFFRSGGGWYDSNLMSRHVRFLYETVYILLQTNRYIMILSY